MKRSLFVVDSHQKVLTAWASYRQSSRYPPRLLTLDRHTDTSRPFRKNFSQETEEARRRLVTGIDFTRPETVEKAVSLLNNDEHIVAAIECGIISSALVLAHNACNTEFDVYKRHRIVCREVRDGEWDRVAESDLLNEAVAGFDRILRQGGEKALHEDRYILDIDLDYFTSFASIKPADPSTLRILAKNAALITIATEPEYVKSGAVDRELTSEYLLGKLKDLLGFS